MIDVLSPSARWTSLALGAALVAFLPFSASGAQSTLPEAINPDVTVFAFTDVGNYGGSGGFVGYAVGTRSCNRGSTPLNWCDQSTGCASGAQTNDHPVIAQNIYRLLNGRFEQIGMSWLKHGFLSTNSSSAGCSGDSGQSCTTPPAGSNQLGVGCTDPYTSSLNGGRPLGPRSEVNATTGAYPFPFTQSGTTTTAADQRIKVATQDVDPAANPGAIYFAEAQYIAPDDAAIGNGMNNASYRQVSVGGSPNFNISLTGTFHEKQAAIYGWPLLDPGATEVDVDIPGSVPLERFQVARRITQTGPTSWHYEYSIRNHNSDRGLQQFSIDFPDGTAFTNIGFHAVQSHSGEPYSNAAWTSSVDDPTSVISWSTETFATNANANALRWATMYSFWFDADSPNAESLGAKKHTLTYFKPGSPSSTPFALTLFSDGFETSDFTVWSETALQ
ncbi:MAG: hypothetical protein ABI639_13970 [Thermoanaerobaculia bacterium]